MLAGMSGHCATVYYSGRVQGVGFRATARQLAAGYDVTGTVRNLSDGRVMLIAQGDRAEVEAFLEAVATSSLAAGIHGTTLEWGAPERDFSGFKILL